MIGEREGIAVAPDDRHIGQGTAELGRHAVAGLDGEHIGAARVQTGGRHARTGADVHHAGAGQGASGQLLDGVEERVRVGGAVGRVLGCGSVEGMGSDGVGGLAGARCRHTAMVAVAGRGPEGFLRCAVRSGGGASSTGSPSGG